MDELFVTNTNFNDEPHKKGENTADEDTICGIGFFKPKWIQKWATSKMFLFWFSLTIVINSTYYNYFIGTISTFEKRFAFKSKISGSILLGEEIMPVIFGIILGYFGNKSHRPRFIAVGNLLAAVCCFCTALPYFIYGSAKSEGIQGMNGGNIQFCNSEELSCETDERPPTMAVIGLLFIANFFRGFSNITTHIIGMPYMDDNTKKKNTPVYFAVSFSLRFLGPLFGYLLSSACLRYYEDPFDDPGYGPTDPRWVGAWWIGFIIQGILLVLFTIPVALFPRRLPGHKAPEQESSIKEERFKDYFAGLLVSMKRLIKNPVLMFQLFCTVMTIWGHVGYSIMLPKYMENQFKMTAAEANLYAGATSVACMMVSIFAGGLLIWKYRPSPKILLLSIIASEVVLAFGFLTQMIPGCQKMELQNFGKNYEGYILEGACNLNCGCTTAEFTPFCGPGGETEFFSPCHAGCTVLLSPFDKSSESQDHKVYGNCSCITDDYGGAEAKIIEGFCPNNECWNQALIYIGLLLFLTLVSTIWSVALTMILFRSVHPRDKGVALGFFDSCLCLFGFIPFPPTFGAIVDSACLVSEKSCGQTGNCWVYDMDNYNYRLHGVSSGFCFLCALGFYGVLKYRDRLQNLYEEDSDSEPRSNMLELKPDSERNL